MIRRNLAFFIPYFLFLLIAGVALLFNEKGPLHLYLNQFHLPAGDFFFKWWTHTGDGVFAVSVVIVLLFINYGKAFLLGFSLLVSTLITQSLKRIIFFDVKRPSAFFEFLDTPLRVVPEVHLHSLNSFPSGHANTAFTIFLALAMFSEKQSVKFLCFVLAMLGAYSRVYLSQHFMVDIYFGSLFAVVITCLIFLYFNDIRMQRFRWSDKSILKRK